MTSTENQAVALIDVPTGETALAAFTADYGVTIGPLLKPVRAAVDEFQRNAEAKTEPGREAIRSFAYKLARSKTALEDAGKAVAAKLKDLPKKVDANRKLARETLEDWQAEVRAPLDAWEATEKLRIDAHVATIEHIEKMGVFPHLSVAVDEIMTLMKRVDTLAPKGDAREEFADEYERVQRIALAALGAAFTARTQYDKDQAELATLRQREREREAKEAVEKAEREAAEKKQREEDAEARRVIFAREAEAREADLRRQKEAADAEAAREGAERRRLEREAADRKAADEKAAEDKRIAEAKDAAAKDEAERKARNTRHRATVNNAAMAAVVKVLAAIPATETHADIAKAIIVAIAKGEIPGVTINY